MPLSTADFDYDLPEASIAQAPLRPRDAARMLVVQGEALEDRGVRDLPSLLRPGDVMVVNDTRVIPARLRARRGEARIEVMLNRAEGDGSWHALIRNARRLRVGDEIAIEGADLTAHVLEKFEGGSARLDFGADPARLTAALEHAGFADADIAKIMGGNWMRILRDAENSRYASVPETDEAQGCAVAMS